jgi:thymidylate synthase (FAD)
MLKLDPLNDGKSRIELINWMGSDLDVVNDARASFTKHSDFLDEKDIKLIRYLIANNHTSPLRGVVFKFKVKAPLYVCRQWWKHVIASNHNDEQLGWNEQSFRYTEVADSADFYIPKEFRLQAKDNRQSSEGSLDPFLTADLRDLYETACTTTYEVYERFLSLGVSREQARGVLVPSVYTQWVWTTSLQSVLHFLGLRLGKGAQSEITAYAEAIRTLILPSVPETLKAWEDIHIENGH